jgi:hypothetical protein
MQEKISACIRASSLSIPTSVNVISGRIPTSFVCIATSIKINVHYYLLRSYLDSSQFLLHL